MQKFDDKVRDGQNILANGKYVVPTAVVTRNVVGDKVVKDVTKNFSYDEANCVPIYIDEV